MELLAPLGPPGAMRSRAMFGGHGLYLDDVFIAIIAAERLYLKVNDSSRPRFEAAGSEPFVYDLKRAPRPAVPAVPRGDLSSPAEPDLKRAPRPAAPAVPRGDLSSPAEPDLLKNQQIALGYYTMPQDALDSPAMALPWARLALEAALRARAAKAAPRSRKPSSQPDTVPPAAGTGSAKRHSR